MYLNKMDVAEAICNVENATKYCTGRAGEGEILQGQTGTVPH